MRQRAGVNCSSSSKILGNLVLFKTSIWIERTFSFLSWLWAHLSHVWRCLKLYVFLINCAHSLSITAAQSIRTHWFTVFSLLAYNKGYKISARCLYIRLLIPFSAAIPITSKKRFSVASILICALNRCLST